MVGYITLRTTFMRAKVLINPPSKDSVLHCETLSTDLSLFVECIMLGKEVLIFDLD